MKMLKPLACLILLFLTSGALAQKNLVSNGGFEDDLYGWNNNGAKTTPWDIKSGKSSCAIIALTITEWTGIDQTISIPKKAEAIEFSAWLKVINVVKGKNDWNGAIFTIEFTDVRDKKVGESVNITTLTGDQNWTLVSKTVNVPAPAVNFKILLALGNASGTMLVDDVSAKAVTAQNTAK